MSQPDRLDVVARDLAARVNPITDRMMARIVAEIPHYAELDPVSLASVRDITVAYWEGCLRAAQERRGPSPDELAVFERSARLRARAGWPLSAILHAYRLAVSTWWDVVGDDVRRQPGDVGTAVELVAALLHYLDDVQSAVTEAYLDEAEQLAANRNRRQQLLVQALVDSNGRSPDVDVLAERAEVELADRYDVVVLTAADDMAASSRVAQALRSLPRTPPVLAAVRTSDVLALWPHGADVWHQVGEALDGLSRASITAAVAESGSDGYRAALAEAEQVLTIAVHHGRSGVIRLEDVLLDALIRQSGGRTAQLVARILDPVFEEQDAKATDLVATLRTYLTCDASTREAGRQLHVHPHTVTYRLERIRALTGLDPRHLHDALLLLAAVELRGHTSEVDRGVPRTLAPGTGRSP